MLSQLNVAVPVVRLVKLFPVVGLVPSDENATVHSAFAPVPAM
jgi:hypothetical protein